MKRLLRFYKSALTGFLLIPFMGFAQDIHFNVVAPPQDDIGNITGMTQDPQGFLWLASENGLYKYDGFQYTSYHHQPLNPNSIGAGIIEWVVADRQGYIWIAHEWLGGGLERLDPATGIFTHFRHNENDPSSLVNDTVSVILQSIDGTIWAGTYGGLDRFDSKTNKFLHYSYNANDSTSLSCNLVKSLYQDKQGTIWVGTGNAFIGIYPRYEGGLNKLNVKTGKFTRYMHKEKDKHSLIDNRIRAIFEDSHGNFWVGSAGDGLHKMNRTNGTFERLLYDPSHPEKLSRPPVQKAIFAIDDPITFITEDTKGRIWIATYQSGINVYDPGTQKCTYYGTGKNSKEKLPDDIFWTAYKTRDSIIWISSWEPNLYKINPYQNKPNYTYTGKSVLAFAEDNANNLWLATDKGLLHKDSTGNEQQFLIDKDSSSYKNKILDIEKDNENRLWIGTYFGLYNFDLGTKHFTVYHPEKDNAKSLVSDTVNIIKKINENKFWLATPGGLQLMDIKTATFKTYQHDPKDSNSISNNHIYEVLEDKNGYVWVATEIGLNRLDKQTNYFKKYLNQIVVLFVFEDSKGILWAGTQAGLKKYDKENDIFLPFSNQWLPAVSTTFVFSITEDHEQNLWLTTLIGFVKLNKDRNEAMLFGKNQGINSIESNDIGYTRQNGEILYGGKSGYFTFTTAQLKQRVPPPIVTIKNFLLNDIPVQPSLNGILSVPLEQTKEIHLNHDQNTFSFEFSNIDFISNHEDSRMFYMLQNYDNNWHNANDSRTAYYFNLPTGEYIFKVKAAGRNSSWVEKDISIIITPPWWKTWWAYCIYGLLLIIGVWLTDRYQKQRIIRIEREKSQKRELAQAKEIEKAYADLKATQAQLIQSEKMASLGELTAGIAHEIQNPLNFVNNFSEVNKELLVEMKEEMNKGNLDNANTIANDVIDNQEKINHHGKRADDIVKGMLQHSQTSKGQQEQTNINKLADEYLKLAYHGLRAKDKAFNATLQTDFNDSLSADNGKINIIPQDIGRVLLNLYNNAFYAVNERSKQQKEDFEPIVSLSTKKINDKIEIRVKDNGNGIPQKIADKIFQPFFTTKPTGQGTGLGLSLSYDIVKAHGGEIKVETREGEGAEFVIQLPAV